MSSRFQSPIECPMEPDRPEQAISCMETKDVLQHAMEHLSLKPDASTSLEMSNTAIKSCSGGPDEFSQKTSFNESPKDDDDDYDADDEDESADLEGGSVELMSWNSSQNISDFRGSMSSSLRLERRPQMYKGRKDLGNKNLNRRDKKVNKRKAFCHAPKTDAPKIQVEGRTLFMLP